MEDMVPLSDPELESWEEEDIVSNLHYDTFLTLPLQTSTIIRPRVCLEASSNSYTVWSHVTQTFNLTSLFWCRWRHIPTTRSWEGLYTP